MFRYAAHYSIDFIDCHIPGIIKKTIKRILPGLSQNYYRFLSKLTSRRLDLVKVRGGALRGRKLICCLKTERDYWLGKWEPELQAILKARLRPGMVVYDVGAHIGVFSLLAAQLVYPTGRVIAFEPSPSNREVTAKNMSLNPDLAGLVELTSFAVSDETGHAILMSADKSSSTSTLARKPLPLGEDARQVPTITLDEFLQRGNPPPQLIKMDIEGGEIYAFSGMLTTLKKHRPELLVEIHTSEAWRYFCKLLQDVDYSATTISEHRFSTTPEWSQRDQYLALPSEKIQNPRTSCGTAC